MHNIDENEVLRDAMQPLNEEVPPMPENLHAAWMRQVEDDAQATKRTEKAASRRSFTRFLSMAAAMVFIVGGTLLTRDDLLPETAANDMKANGQRAAGGLLIGGAYTTAADEDGISFSYSMDTGVNTAAPKLRSTAAAEPEAASRADKKIIRTADLTISTRTYDSSMAALIAGCEGQGGWVESSTEYADSYSELRTAHLTLRVPQDFLDAYLTTAGDLGRITYRSESAEDVTATYQDTQARLDTQLALMTRLQALITESANLTELLALEKQMADTQYEIDRLQSSLTSTDRQVTYSTVSITLQEETTVEITDTTVSLGERISAAIGLGWDALTGFFADMVVFLVAAAPFIAIVILLVIVLRIIWKIRRKK